MSFIKTASITPTLINDHGRHGVDKNVYAATNVYKTYACVDHLRLYAAAKIYIIELYLLINNEIIRTDLTNLNNPTQSTKA